MMNIWTSCTISSILALSLLAPSVSFANENPNQEAAVSKEAASQYPILKKANKPEEAGFSSEKLEKRWISLSKWKWLPVSLVLP